jgi:asparagine synthase (glutamine-hydrolysing)
MCGIAGILQFNPGASPDEARLVAMRDSLVHRGPDGAGLIIDGPVGLAHRRLSIIDLAGGHQPMGNQQRGTWITYNGELYNFRELRLQMQRMGCQFETNSDTEVVLRAYEVYGDGCVDHLRGMFAFAIWDGPNQRLFLARDRLGIKPLYFSLTDSELLFGSEIKAILAGTAGKPAFNRAILPEYLASRYVAGDETFFEGIWKLLPAHTLSWTAGEGIRKHRYWQPALGMDDAGRSYEDYVEEVRTGLEDAVRSHLVSDVPVGLFLSGGLDSTALAGLMAPLADGPIQTFSVGFNEGVANELDYARLAAARVGARHRDVLMTPEQFFAELPQMIWHEDEPLAFPSSIPLNAISRLAREHVKVVLTGEGADELFLGYDYRYRVTALNARLGGVYEKLLPQGLRTAVADGVAGLPKRLRRYAERSFLALASNPRDMFFENFAVFRHAQRQRMLVNFEQHASRDPYAQCLRHYHAGGTETLQCMSHADLQTYLVELLMKQDQMSMAASIESRVPFLDHRLVEQVASIPARHRMRGWRTKPLLRDAVRDLVPQQILKRGKMGFPVPVGTWLQDQFWPLVEEFALGHRARLRGLFDAAWVEGMASEHRQGSANHADRLWLLINLEIWQRIFIDGEEPSELAKPKMGLASFDSSQYPVTSIQIPVSRR